MAESFDDIIFVISTDCFTDELLGEFSRQDVEKVKYVARNAIPTIINGGDNYYMCADFSMERMQKTQHDFFSELIAQQVGADIRQKIQLFYDILKGITDQLRTAAYAINSVAARLYWLDTDRFRAPITDELFELITLVEPLGLDRKSHGFEWEDIWLNSPSEWDQFVMSLMDGIDEVPYLTFKDITRFSSQFDFLGNWKTHLGEARFTVIRNYVLAEAHAELDALNPGAAKEVDRIMSSI